MVNHGFEGRIVNNEDARLFIRSYLDFVSTIHQDKETPKCPLTQTERAKIHDEFGMSDEKARVCRKFGRQQLKKSIALAQEGLLVQSIEKAERAMYLRPDDPKPLVMLMRLYMPKYRNEIQAAKFYAQHVLRLDPSHQKANECLNEDSNKTSRRTYLIGASLAACLVFGGLFYTQSEWVPVVEAMYSSDTPSEQRDNIASQQNSDSQKSGNNTEEYEKDLLKNQSLPLSIDKGGEGFAIEDRGSTWHTAERSLTYDLRAVLHNRSAAAYGVITGTVSILGENDVLIVQKFQELHTFYELPLYPRQSHPIAIRLYISELPETMPIPVRVVIELQEKTEDLNPKPTTIDVPVDWNGFEKSTQSIQVRQRAYTPQKKDGQWNHAVAFEVTNTGTDIRRLNMRFAFLDEKQEEITKTDTLVTFEERPLIAPKETRVVTIRETISKPTVRIQTSVLEMK